MKTKTKKLKPEFIKSINLYNCCSTSSLLKDFIKELKVDNKKYKNITFDFDGPDYEGIDTLNIYGELKTKGK